MPIHQAQKNNSTLLALATHIEGLSTPTPQVVPEIPSPIWQPEHSEMLLWKNDKEGLSWENHYRGSKIFLICSGPSLNDLDLSLIDNRGVMSMCMNNSWCMVKPDMWIGFDAPGRFHNEGWFDPSIMKIVPWQNRNKPLNHRVGGNLVDSGKVPMDTPNCWYLSNTSTFDESLCLEHYELYITWDSKKFICWDVIGRCLRI